MEKNNNFQSKAFQAMQRVRGAMSGHYSQLVFTAVLVFALAWLGYTARVIGSREICDAISIQVTTRDGGLAVLQPQAELAHAGNIVPLTQDRTRGNTWGINKVFIKKLFLAVDESELGRIESGVVTIGDKVFEFNGADLAGWPAESGYQNNPYFQSRESGQVVIQFPEVMHSEVSRLPLLNRVFGGVMNWAGDGKLLVAPVAAAVKLFIVVLLSSIICFLLLLPYYNTGNLLVKREEKNAFLAFAAALLITSCLLMILGLAVKLFYKPDIGVILSKVREVYISQLVASFLPEPVERLQFVLTAAASPFILAFTYRYVLRRIEGKSELFINWWHSVAVPLTGLILFGLVFCGLAMSNFLYTRTSIFAHPYGKVLYALVLFPVLLWFSFKADPYSRVRKMGNAVFGIFLGLLLGSVLLLSIISISNIYDPYHLNPVFYPIAQLYLGKSLFVGWGSFYGLYPVFLYPVFKLIGLSVLKFSVIMSALLLLSFAALYGFLRQEVKSKLILLSGICSVFIYSYSVFVFYGTQVYFQYWPIRFLPASVLTFLVSLYLKKNRNQAYYYATFLWCCFALFWNLETGAVMMAAWLLFLAYCDFFETKGSGVWKKLVRHLIVTMGFLVLAIAAFVLYTHLHSGAYPDFGFFYKYQQLFVSGFFLIAMLPPPHIWSFIILVYLAGLLYSIKVLAAQSGESGKIVFFLSVLGVGLFSYYEGRSQDLALIGPSFVAVLLIAVFADKLLNSAKERKVVGSGIITLLALFFLYSGPVSLLTLSPKLFQTVKDNVTAAGKAEGELGEDASFIRQNTYHGEKILILYQNRDGIYYGESGTLSVLDLPSSTEYYTKAEFGDIIGFLKSNQDVKVFVSLYNPPSAFEDVNEAVRQYYDIGKTGGGLGLLVKKQ